MGWGPCSPAKPTKLATPAEPWIREAGLLLPGSVGVLSQELFAGESQNGGMRQRGIRQSEGGKHGEVARQITSYSAA